MNISPTQLLTGLFTDALDEMHPGERVKYCLESENIRSATAHRPVYILAAGKAAIPMARAAGEQLDLPANRTLVIAPEESPDDRKQLRILRANHPVPGPNSLEAGKKAVEFVSSLPGGSVLVCLISGGTSAMLCYPADGVPMEDLARTNRLLLRSGADILQINTVRRKLSRIKGGKLLNDIDPGVTVINLVISDVPGDDPALVGSGPTVPQEEIDNREFRRVLNDLDLWEAVPESVKNYAAQEASRSNLQMPEVMNRVIASAPKLARAVKKLAGQRGINAYITDRPYKGDVQQVTGRILEEIQGASAGLFVFYGESTVEVTGNGKGGRNQELALRAAMAISGMESVSWLSAGTDGVDGPTDAAGAVVDGNTITKAAELGMDPQDYLGRNDSYHFHKRAGTLLKTGPTGNNLMDLQLVLKER